MGDEKCSQKLTGHAGRRRHGKKVKEAVQSKDQKDQAKKETGDDSSNFHVNVFCLI